MGKKKDKTLKKCQNILFALSRLCGSSSHKDICISKTGVIPEKPKHNKIIVTVLRIKTTE